METPKRGEAQTELSRTAPDRKANRVILRRTLFLMLLFGLITFLPLFHRLYTIQIRDHAMYQQKAIDQQTMDNPVSISAIEPAKFTIEVQILAANPISSPTSASFSTMTVYPINEE